MTGTLASLAKAYPNDTLNLCDHCSQTFATCSAIAEEVVFNSAPLKDNVLGCSEFDPAQDGPDHG
ncbi:MAG: hypothetical protein OEX12_08910 [Gammaproteobacteria bacterium]|nr:hypothetical protein [Gammaproteobacteria bacterium]